MSAAQTLIAHQQEAVDHYLVCSAGVVQQQDAMPQPQDVVDAASLLDSLLGFVSSSKHDATTHDQQFINYSINLVFFTHTALLRTNRVQLEPARRNKL